MAITVKVQDDSDEEKKTRTRPAYCIPVLIGIVIVTLLAALIYVVYTYIEINGLLTESKRQALEEEEIKIRLYILESDYYLDDIDKEESKFEHITNDFKKIMRFASARKPECTSFTTTGQPHKDIEDLEKSARSNIQYFKHILNSWIDNIDYMDLDGTFNKLLSEYEDIYFNQGDWKDGKVDDRLKKLKELYESKTIKVEECTVPSVFGSEVKQKLQFLRERMKLHNDELEKESYIFKKLDEEIIKTVNRMAFENVMCLGNFPDFWESIQKEEILADQALTVLKFKLRQMRYNLMAADSPEKVNNLIKWEEEFSKRIAEKFTNDIQKHYENAVRIYNAALKDIDVCFSINNYLY